MIETLHLLPPVTGPGSDPTLFGVADGLARLFPLEDGLVRSLPEPAASDAIVAERMAESRAAA